MEINETVDCYFNELNNYDVLSKEEEYNLLVKAKDGNESAREKIIKHNLKFVVSIANEYKGCGLPLEDLINEGNIGLIKSIDRYDLNSGNKFITYAVHWIRQGIRQSLNDNSRMIRLPNNIINEMYYDKKNNNENIYIQNNGINVKSLNNNIYENKTLIEYIKYEENYDCDKDHKNSLLKNMVFNLKENEQYILNKYFGLDNEDPLNLENIATNLNISKQRVNQIKERALNKLRYDSKELYKLIVK